MEERIRRLIKNTKNVILAVQEISTVLNGCKCFDDLQPIINVIREYKIVENIDALAENARIPKNTTPINTLAYLVNEILFNVVSQNIQYNHDKNFNDFMYLVISSRLLFSYTSVYFEIEKDEMESSTDLKKTYNRLVLLNKI